MNNEAMVGMFSGCFYDSEENTLYWNGENASTKAPLDCNGLATDTYAKFKDGNGSWSDWRKLQMASRVAINEGIRHARTLGISLDQLGNMKLADDRQTILVE